MIYNVKMKNIIDFLLSDRWENSRLQHGLPVTFHFSTDKCDQHRRKKVRAKEKHAA